MKKYLVLLLCLCVASKAMANIVIVETNSGYYTATITGDENLNYIKEYAPNSDEYRIKDANIFVENFQDWQNWDKNVKFDGISSVYIENINTINLDEPIKHIKGDNQANIVIKNPNNLFKSDFYHLDNNEDIFLRWVRETNYQKIFVNDNRGDFLESLRVNHPDNKMLAAMDSAQNMDEINSIMNSSYHFNPMVLMNPMKTINRSNLNLLMDKSDVGFGVVAEYIGSGKIKDFGTHIQFGSNYNDFYFNVGLNLNKFSYTDSFNKFDGFSYGGDVRAKQYIEHLWFDGLIGLNRTIFNTDEIYQQSNPKGMSEYARLSFGYDYTRFTDLIISPFVGGIFQNYGISGISDKYINFHTGVKTKYSFEIDGMKYEYGAFLSIDNKAHWDIGGNIGVNSIADNIGAFVTIDIFHDEFDTNYKLSLNAKMQF